MEVFKMTKMVKKIAAMGASAYTDLEKNGRS